MEFKININQQEIPILDYSFSYDKKKVISDNTDLEKTKNKISEISLEKWKKLRKSYNVYDFECNNVINRAFYKLWEINSKYKLYEKPQPVILHLAEAPGGFIQSSLFLTTNQKKTVIDEEGYISVSKHHPSQIVTMSLKNTPKSTLSNYHNKILKKNVFITYGEDNTGNITNLKNLDFIDSVIGKKFDIITADGGFDEGSLYNNKEELHYNLILSEIYGAINYNNHNGHFVLKMFDTFTETSIQLLYLLSLYYESIIVYKPKTSRPTNSEKYIICKNFKKETSFHNEILFFIKDLSNKFKEEQGKVMFFTLFKIPDYFTEQIINLNIYFKNNQIKTINKMLSMHNSTKSLPISKFTEWSKEFNFNFNQ